MEQGHEFGLILIPSGGMPLMSPKRALEKVRVTWCKIVLPICFYSVGCSATNLEHQNPVIDSWMQGQPVFGVFAPSESRIGDARDSGGERPRPIYTPEGARALAENTLYDFVFLNLEGSYDSEAVEVLVEGLKVPSGSSRKTLLVRIPSIADDGEELTKSRVEEIMDLGADGVVFPHVRSVEEAQMIAGFFQSLGVEVWSPSNPTGDKLAMIMIEDPVAVGLAAQMANVNGYSILACGIGSLTRALGGDREASEEGNLNVLAEATRVGLPDMITANVENVQQRLDEGFLALLMQGAEADDAIRLARTLAYPDR
jgi:hypothetical protein